MKPENMISVEAVVSDEARLEVNDILNPITQKKENRAKVRSALLKKAAQKIKLAREKEAAEEAIQQAQIKKLAHESDQAAKKAAKEAAAAQKLQEQLNPHPKKHTPVNDNNFTKNAKHALHTSPRSGKRRKTKKKHRKSRDEEDRREEERREEERRDNMN